MLEMQVSVCVHHSYLYFDFLFFPSLCSLVKLPLAGIIARGHNKVAESKSKNEKA